MKWKAVLFLTVLLLVLPTAFAQGVYLGGGVTLSNPGLSAQFGVGLPAGLEIRAVLLTAGGLNKLDSAGVDFLYSIGLPSSRLYLGAGGDAFFVSAPSDAAEASKRTLGLHTTGGAELRLGSFGFFGEVRPGLKLGPFEGYIRTRVGLNLHF